MVETVIKEARPQMVGDYYEPVRVSWSDAIEALAIRRTFFYEACEQADDFISLVERGHNAAAPDWEKLRWPKGYGKY